VELLGRQATPVRALRMILGSLNVFQPRSHLQPLAAVAHAS